MSGVRFVFPKPLLAELLKAPGGMAIADAVGQAQANLDTLRPQGRVMLKELAQRIETAFDLAMQSPKPVPPIGILYTLASGGVGMGVIAGVDSADVALVSMCRLLDYLQTGKRWDAAAVMVHIQSLKFLVNAETLAPGEADAMLKGLEKVTLQNSPSRR